MPDQSRSQEPALAVVFRTHSDIEASLVRGLLEAHGIFAALSSDLPHSVFPLSIDGLGEVRVSVPATQADEARLLIADHGPQAGPARVVRIHEARDLSALEERLGYRFRDPRLLDRALTHRSKANEDREGTDGDNEALEFLGDAVLGFVMADLLYRDFPQYDEGQKSKIKASLVSTATLGELARELGLGEHLALGKGEEKTGGRHKHALLADSFEAVIAAIYLDGEMGEARTFILRQFEPLLEEVRSSESWGRDHKSALQELVQSRNLPLPEYVVTAESGPDHRKLFRVEVRVEGEVLGSAEGLTKKAAEQEAARRALARLDA